MYLVFKDEPHHLPSSPHLLHLFQSWTSIVIKYRTRMSMLSSPCHVKFSSKSRRDVAKYKSNHAKVHTRDARNSCKLAVSRIKKKFYVKKTTTRSEQAESSARCNSMLFNSREICMYNKYLITLVHLVEIGADINQPRWSRCTERAMDGLRSSINYKPVIVWFFGELHIDNRIVYMINGSVSVAIAASSACTAVVI